MRRQRKSTSSVPFVKKDEELFDGDEITIVNEGQHQEGQFGEQFVIKIELNNGEERAMTINQTSENNLIDAYGDDSITWVGKKAVVWMEKKKINGKRVTIAYLAAPGWVRDEFGDFFPAESKLKPTTPARRRPVKVEEDIQLEDVNDQGPEEW
jgi:hypothetical protein